MSTLWQIGTDDYARIVGNKKPTISHDEKPALKSVVRCSSSLNDMFMAKLKCGMSERVYVCVARRDLYEYV